MTYVSMLKAAVMNTLPSAITRSMGENRSWQRAMSALQVRIEEGIPDECKAAVGFRQRSRSGEANPCPSRDGTARERRGYRSEDGLVHAPAAPTIAGLHARAGQ